MLAKEYTPAYVPAVASAADVSNFDKVYTQEAPEVSTASVSDAVAQLGRSQPRMGTQASTDDASFRAFSFTSPDALPSLQ